MMENAIVIGASSGIGRALAKVLAERGYALGLAARRLPLLVSLQKEIASPTAIRQMDISDTGKATGLFFELVQEMGGVDLVVISAGTGFPNPNLDWGYEKRTIEVNVSGFTALADAAIRYFIGTGQGHLVGISSLAALRGNSEAPAYNASKAFMSTYLQGLRYKVKGLGLPITVTDIQPGFVDTSMAQSPSLFWVASPEKAADQIYQAIRRKRKQAYITKRWRLFAWVLKLAPDRFFEN
jgi:short-subunit dehydrogenase